MLVVDGDVLVREGIARLLGGVPEISVVGEVETAGEAVDAVRRLRPDLVVLAPGTLVEDVEAVAAVGRFVDPPTGAAGLTTREIDVLSHLAHGETGPEIAAALDVSPHTVQTYVKRATGKLGARNRTQAVATAVRLGLV